VIKVVEGTNEVLMPGLRAGELDLVVGRLPTHRHRSDLGQMQLYDEEIVACVRAGHPLAERKGVGLKDMVDFDWILPPAETTLRRQLDQHFASRPEVAPKRVVESVSYLTNRALVVNSDIISVLPGQVAAVEIAGGAFARLDWAVPVGTGPVGVSFRRSGGLSPAAQAFIRKLSEVGKSIGAKT